MMARSSDQPVYNTVAQVELLGGVIGLIFFPPRKRIAHCIRQHNDSGWRLVQIVHVSKAGFMLQMLVFLLTLGMITIGDTLLLVFEQAAPRRPPEPTPEAKPPRRVPGSDQPYAGRLG